MALEMVTTALRGAAFALKRKSIQRCSDWACRYRMMGKPFPGPWTFARHPWLKGIHDSKSEVIVCQKGAQLGVTETALNRTFFVIDVKRESILYILPATVPDAKDFSTGRFDPALEGSPYLTNLFSDVSNVGLKRAGHAILYIRGSKSRGQMKSIPVGNIIFDEYEEMNMANARLAVERVSGYPQKSLMYLSTPTIEDRGINNLFKTSTQDHFFFRCPHTGRFTELVFPDCLVVCGDRVDDPRLAESQIISLESKKPISLQEKIDALQTGVWISKTPDSDVQGYYINQLYSTTISPKDLAKNFLEAERDPASEQEFWNSKGGLCHEVKGARLTEAEVDGAIGDYTTIQSANTGLVTMGIDVGKRIHYSIVKWQNSKALGAEINLLATAQVIAFGTVKEFSELTPLMLAFGVNYACIDRQPETRLSREFCRKYYGIARMVGYEEGINARDLKTDDAELAVKVDRTSWIDLTMSRFRNNSIRLPRDINDEFKQNLRALVRIYEKDTNGNDVGKYVHGDSKPDHYMHTLVYNDIALALFAAGGVNQNL